MKPPDYPLFLKKRLLSAFSIIIILWLLFTPHPALAAGKVALVIGNSRYKMDPLPNPVNDATDMAGVLEKLGFEVILEKDADKSAMVGSLRIFHKRLGTAEIGLFYYAGHGMQINGSNYLIPVRHAIAEEFEVESEAISADRILSAMESAGTPLNIVILDACRNNPFQSFRGARKGLAEMKAPRGTIISYATSPGSLAEDGRGRNGTYTEALLKNFQDPYLDVQKMFNQTGLDVMEKTDGRQMPWVSTTPFPDYFLAGGVPEDRDLRPVQPQSAVISQSAAQDRPLIPEQATQMMTATELTAEKREEKPASSPAAAVKPDRAPPGSPGPGQVWKEPATGMAFVWVPGGCYLMGSPLTGNTAQTDPEEQPLWYKAVAAVSCLLPYGCVSGSTGINSYYDTHGYHEEETPVHEVCMKGFWIGRYEVPQGLWLNVMGSNPSRFKYGDDFPVENVSWNDAKQFISRLNEQIGPHFALPTEAQWEYAARSGGQKETYAGGNDIDRVAWYKANSGGKTHRVGTKAPNGLGVYDMSGNVWEWCEDVYDENAYSKHDRDNPVITSGRSVRVVRGGSWISSDVDVRTSYRIGASADYSSIYRGVRLSLTP